MNKKRNLVIDQSNSNYPVRNEIVYFREVLKSNFCDNNNTSIQVREDATIIGDNGTKVAFKNYPPFIKCVNDLDLVMPMYDFTEHNLNHFGTTDSL